MATLSDKLGLTLYDGSDNWDRATYNSDMQSLDDHPGILVCTTATRPGSPWQGQVIFDTDLSSVLSWSGTAWVPPETLTPVATVVRQGAQSVDSGSGNSEWLTFTTEEDVTWDMADLDEDADRAVCTVPGRHLVGCGVYFHEGDATGYRRVRVLLNGTDPLIDVTVPAVADVPTCVATPMRSVSLTVGDFVVVELSHTDGAALNVGSTDSGERTTFLTVVKP